MTIPQLYDIYLMHPSVCTDTRKIIKGDLFFALKGDNFDGNKFASQALDKGASFAVVDDPALEANDRFIVVANALKTLQQLGTFHRRQLGVPVIGLTGSNGKTTTKELIYSVLSRKYNTHATAGNFNNHIGVPLSLLQLNEKHELAIIEMGANHQKEIEFLSSLAEPDYGYITNFGKAHLEGFGGVEGVIKGKSELYTFLKQNGGTIFINGDDPIQQKQLSEAVKTVVFNSDEYDGPYIEFISGIPTVSVKVNSTEIHSNLSGDYNFNNIAAAIAIGAHFGVETSEIKLGIESYVPENNRSQVVQWKGNTVYLDAYNANPTSMKAALDNFGKVDAMNKIAVLGDMFELGEYAEMEHQAMVDLALDLDITHLWLAGENFYQTKSEDQRCKKFNSFEELKAFWDSFEHSGNQYLLKGSRGMAMERLLK